MAARGSATAKQQIRSYVQSFTGRHGKSAAGSCVQRGLSTGLSIRQRVIDALGGTYEPEPRSAAPATAGRLVAEAGRAAIAAAEAGPGGQEHGRRRAATE